MVHILRSERPRQHIFYSLKIRRCGMSSNETTVHPSHNVLRVNHYRSKYDLQHGACGSPRTKSYKGHDNTTFQLVRDMFGCWIKSLLFQQTLTNNLQTTTQSQLPSCRQIPVACADIFINVVLVMCLPLCKSNLLLSIEWLSWICNTVNDYQLKHSIKAE